jgi:hypothetical protein
MGRLVRFVLSTAFLTACGVTGPGNRAGPYVLSALDGSNLPHLVASTSLCDELVPRGTLNLDRDGSFLLQVAQVHDCSRGGGAVDSFTTTITGGFTLAGAQLALHPARTGVRYDGTVSSGALEVHLPPLPLAGSTDHVATFINFPL